MSDTYIDLDEVSKYGKAAAKALRDQVKGLIPAYDAAIDYNANALAAATAKVGAVASASRSARADVSIGLPERTTALDAGREALGQFSKHLDTHPKGQVNCREFFHADGTIGGVGRGATDVLGALDDILEALANDETTSHIENEAHWVARIEAAASALSPGLAHAGTARSDWRKTTPEIERARAAWLHRYAVAKDLTRSVLRDVGKLGVLPLVFPDLAVVERAPDASPPS